MTPAKAKKLLIEFSAWRRGAETEQPNPTELGKAIDVAIEALKVAAKNTEKLRK